MALGTYVIDSGVSPPETYFGNTNATECDLGQFSQSVKIASLLMRVYRTGTFTGKAVIYDSSGTKIADGPTQNMATSSSTTLYEIPFTTPVLLNANTNYYIGYFIPTNPSQGQPGVGAKPASPLASSPAFATWTPSGHYYNANGGGDAFPTSSNSGYIFAGGMSFNSPNSAPFVKEPHPEPYSVVDPRRVIRVSWGYTDTEGNSITKAEFSYRELGTTTWSTPVEYTATSSSYFDLPANTFAMNKKYAYRLRIFDGQDYSDYSYGSKGIVIDTSAWKTEEVDNPSSKQQIQTLIASGTYEAQAGGRSDVLYSDWSSSSNFDSVGATKTYVFKNGIWQAAPKKFYIGGSWSSGVDTAL